MLRTTAAEKQASCLSDIPKIIFSLYSSISTGISTSIAKYMPLFQILKNMVILNDCSYIAPQMLFAHFPVEKIARMSTTE